MMSLKPPSAYSRFLSPKRRLNVLAGDDCKPSLSAPNSPLRSSRNWRSTSTKYTANTKQRIPTRLHSYREILGMSGVQGNLFSSDKGQQDSNDIANVSLIKSGKGQYMDARSIMKMLASLHIDVPDLVGRYQKLMSSTSGKKATQATQDDSSLENKLVNTTSKSEVMPKEPTRNQYWSDDVEDAKREQYNFGEAMKATSESVNAYFLEQAQNNGRTESKSKTLPGEGSNMTTLPAVSTVADQIQAGISLVDQLRQYIPGAKSLTKEELGRKKLEKFRTELVTKSAIDRRTRGLVMGLKRTTSDVVRITRLEDFCNHLMQHPSAKAVAVQEMIIPVLLKMMKRSEDIATKESVHKALTMVGYVFPVKERGVRILSIDGGGTRGLMALQMLKEIEKLSGKPIRELFDYVCGVSTGGLIAVMLSIKHVSLDRCEQLYRQFSKEMFNRSRWIGTSKLVTSHAYYDHGIWEKILKENIGDDAFITSARDINCPKVSVVSTLMNRQTVENYLFRNYTYLEGTTSHYPGSYHYSLCEGIRASSAAPTYYQECKIGDFIHQDGGVLTNNPTAIAIHEARLLWPEVPIQTVISIGTGRYRPTADLETSLSLKEKINKIVQSATDTEAVHTMLQDLLPPSTYFRFSPYMSEDFTLDEIREEKWEQMKTVTDMYIRKNELKIQKAAQVLGQTKLPHHKVKEWVKVTLDEHFGV